MLFVLIPLCYNPYHQLASEEMFTVETSFYETVNNLLEETTYKLGDPINPGVCPSWKTDYVCCSKDDFKPGDFWFNLFLFLVVLFVAFAFKQFRHSSYLPLRVRYLGSILSPITIFCEISENFRVEMTKNCTKNLFNFEINFTVAV